MVTKAWHHHKPRGESENDTLWAFSLELEASVFQCRAHRPLCGCPRRQPPLGSPLTLKVGDS